MTATQQCVTVTVFFITYHLQYFIDEALQYCAIGVPGRSDTYVSSQSTHPELNQPKCHVIDADHLSPQMHHGVEEPLVPHLSGRQSNSGEYTAC